MPRKRSFCARLQQILNDLDHLEKRWLNRSDVEMIFGLRRSQADALMSEVGKEPGVGGESVVAREVLLFWLERGPDAQAIRKEQERKNRLAERLSQSRLEMKGNSIQVAVIRKDELGAFRDTMLRDLPNVRFEGNELRVTFTSKEDLFLTLQRFAVAMINDDQARDRIGKPAGGANVPSL